MIRLERGACPQILLDRGEEWTRSFLESDGKRPRSRRYRHDQVREALVAMAAGKCFYCETRLLESEQTVDHYVEVAEDRSQAFEWSNLYLCCSGCQHQLTSVPRAECLDPCGDVEPAEHLAFDDEHIIPRHDSELGRQTIRRYKLDRMELDLRRSRRLRRFYDRLAQRALSGEALTTMDREDLRRFAQRDQPYSLMFAQLVRCLGL